MSIITEDPVKKNGGKFWSYTEELRIVIWRPVYSNYGATKSPGLGQIPSSYYSAKISEPTTIAADSLIAQLHSTDKLTTPRRENRKIRHETEIVKANEPASCE
jgi:hypothetical protein